MEGGEGGVGGDRDDSDEVQCCLWLTVWGLESGTLPVGGEGQSVFEGPRAGDFMV